jgi:predicted secreted acid phosphatase
MTGTFPVLRRLVSAALLALVLVLTAMVPSTQAAAMPSRQQWLHDTVTALAGSRPYVAKRVTQGGSKLALNLDIDNTSLQTYYAAGQAVPATIRLVRYAKSKGVYILFNTGRNVSQRKSTIAQLKKAGYPVDGLCAHYKGEALAHSKQRCRTSFANNGFHIIANVGNRSTDFTGKGYERAYRLPSYNNRLG